MKFQHPKIKGRMLKFYKYKQEKLLKGQKETSLFLKVCFLCRNQICPGKITLELCTHNI